MKINFRIITITLVLMLGTFILMTGCSKEDKSFAETLVLTVDNSKVYLDEMMYHVMLAEMKGKLYASFIGDDSGYWDMKNEDGTTMAEAMKDIAMQNAIKYELFYILAMKEGYTLSEEEKELSQSKADNILFSIQEEELKLTKLTKEKLEIIQEKISISTKYYDNFIKDLGVDEDRIKEQINIEDFKQYDIQYIFAKEKEYDLLSDLLEAATQTEDITILTKDPLMTSGKLTFLEGQGTFGEETNLEEVILSMSVGEVSSIVETVKGYYIIKLIENTSFKKYDEAVKEAEKIALIEIFEPAYDALKKNHKIKIIQKVWKQIKIGI